MHWLLSQAHATDLDRRPGESVTSYAGRLLPPGSELASNAVELKLGTLGKVTVILFTPDKEVANYTGWVMVPTGPTPVTYRKVVLPPLTTAEGLFDIEVKSIFATDVDADGVPELCVLSQYYRNGSGEKAYPATDCFRWKGEGFGLVEASGPLTVGLRDAKSVRSYFLKHPIKRGAGLPPSGGKP
ncbi:MAG TPA: hypothetical protein VHO67_09830 [Polyangia bacterium]|nr:hypothetical protein [Polyangia bacterium]